MVDISRLGGIVTKTITLHPRPGNPPPRLWETPCGMINSIGLANPGLETFIREIVPRIEKLPTNVVVSIGGESEEEFAVLAKALGELGFVKAIEVNLSCPNVSAGGIHFGRDAALVERLLAKLADVTEKPLWPKLSPQTSDVVELGRACERGGASAIVVANTIPAAAIDIETLAPRVATVTGGLSGPAIHPVAVALVYKLWGEVSIPIVGVGGIAEPKDALELMLAGATAVEVGSAIFSNFELPQKITEFIEDYALRHKYSSTSQITGAFARRWKSP